MSELEYDGGCWVHDDSDAEPGCDMCQWLCPECPDDVRMELGDDVLVCPQCETRITLPATVEDDRV